MRWTMYDALTPWKIEKGIERCRSNSNPEKVIINGYVNHNRQTVNAVYRYTLSATICFGQGTQRALLQQRSDKVVHTCLSFGTTDVGEASAIDIVLIIDPKVCLSIRYCCQRKVRFCVHQQPSPPTINYWACLH